MLLMVEKGIRERIFNAIYIYATVSNKYMKKYNKDKESPSIKYLDENNLYGGHCLKSYLQMVLNGKSRFLNSMELHSNKTL